MPLKKTPGQQAQRAMSDHVTRASAEVRGWPEWKKAFASDVYSVSIDRFHTSSAPKPKSSSGKR